MSVFITIFEYRKRDILFFIHFCFMFIFEHVQEFFSKNVHFLLKFPQIGTPVPGMRQKEGMGWVAGHSFHYRHRPAYQLRNC